jgi:hypothetical protein
MQTEAKVSRNLSEAAEIARARRWFAWIIAVAMVFSAVLEAGIV